MKCMLCGGEMKRNATPFHVDRNGYHLVMDEVPAWVCSQCGEAYFEEAEVITMQNMMRAIDAESTKLRKAG